jgi:hypothetical protein
LESLDFEWDSSGSTWQQRFNELANYRKIYGHCDVSQNCGEDTKLANWVATQRGQYRDYQGQEGKKSPMTPFRIQELESLGFFPWEFRLRELADYRKIHGHCNVPQDYSENTRLANWVTTQRDTYRLHLEGKTSPLTPFHIQELDGLGFEWKPHNSHKKETPKNPSVDDDVTRVPVGAVEAPEHVQTIGQTQDNFVGREIDRNEADVAFKSEELDWNGKVPLGYIPGETPEI